MFSSHITFLFGLVTCGFLISSNFGLERGLRVCVVRNVTDSIPGLPDTCHQYCLPHILLYMTSLSYSVISPPHRPLVNEDGQNMEEKASTLEDLTISNSIE